MFSSSRVLERIGAGRARRCRYFWTVAAAAARPIRFRDHLRPMHLWTPSPIGGVIAARNQGRFQGRSDQPDIRHGAGLVFQRRTSHNDLPNLYPLRKLRGGTGGRPPQVLHLLRATAHGAKKIENRFDFVSGGGGPSAFSRWRTFCSAWYLLRRKNGSYASMANRRTRWKKREKKPLATRSLLAP